MSLDETRLQHVFIIGSKSIGQYGGYETFVDKLTQQHKDDKEIKYHIACKANGDGFMDESKLSGVEVLKKNKNGEVVEFTYHNAHVFKITCPNIGPAVALYYDQVAVKYCLRYCKENHIEHPIFYILACRIGLWIKSLSKKIHRIGGTYYVNPDGHEWKRAKWSAPIRKYWKWSEEKMVRTADLVVCDSVNIEKYIQEQYGIKSTTYISYGADIQASPLSDDDPKFQNWLSEHGLSMEEYYLVVGRFVPENNYETMIREYMRSKSTKVFALITNVNEKFLSELETKLHFQNDPRIRFVGTVYDAELLKKIRECAYGYFHGHEVGGTNPSLLEALGSTKLNLLLDVGFNREVGKDAALYWTKDEGNLASVIDQADQMDKASREEFGKLAKARITEAYSWKFIGDEYKRIFASEKT